MSTPAAIGEFPRTDLTTCKYGFLPRKRPRVTEDQRVSRGPTATQGLLSVDVDVVMGRAAGPGAASTSGSVANGACVSGDILPRLINNQSAEMDALVRLEVERMRCSLEEAHRRHARARLALAQLESALRRNSELENRARQVAADGLRQEPRGRRRRPPRHPRPAPPVSLRRCRRRRGR